MDDASPDEHLEVDFEDRVTAPDLAAEEEETDLFIEALLAGDEEEGDEIDPAFAAWLAKLEETADEQRVAQFDQFDEDWRR